MGCCLKSNRLNLFSCYHDVHLAMALHDYHWHIFPEAERGRLHAALAAAGRGELCQRKCCLGHAATSYSLALLTSKLRDEQTYKGFMCSLRIRGVGGTVTI